MKKNYQVALFLFLIFLTPLVNAIGCLNAKFSNPNKISSPNNVVVLVTHPSVAYDFSTSAKDGIDRLASFAKQTQSTSIFLQNTNLVDVYTLNCEPDYWISSQAGEFSFLLQSETVFFGGGYWELCQESTLTDVIRSWSITQPNEARLIQVMDSIYISGTYIYPSDEFYSRYKKVLENKASVVFPEEPTITLSELMNVMREDGQIVEMLSRNLPNFGFMPSNYEVQLFFKGSYVKKLRSSNSITNIKILKLDFIDSIL